MQSKKMLLLQVKNQNSIVMKFYKVVLAAFIGTLIALVINFFI